MPERPAWWTEEYPELRDGPPWAMAEMVASEAGLVEPILAARAAEPIGEAVRAAVRAGQPVVVTGCGTSEHAAMGVAAQLDEAVRSVGLPGGRVEVRQAFDAALDPRSGGVIVAISHEGATVPTLDALRAAGGLGALTAGITGNAEGTLAATADHVIVTPAFDGSWCHTVGYVSPLLAGAAIASALADEPLEPAVVRAHVEAAYAVGAQAASVAAALHGIERLILVGAGVDAITASELTLKVEEGLHLPSSMRHLETFLHGHFPACDERAGVVLILTGRRGREERTERGAGLLLGSRHLGMRTAAIVAPSVDRAFAADLTTAGRIVVPEEARLPASLEALLGGALALQQLTLGLVHEAGTNPDLIRREQDVYREAAALSRPEGG